MDWEELRYLLALSRGGTMEQAARELGVNYTTVSRRLMALQEHAGVRLIEKNGRRYILTDAGLAAVAAAEKMETHSTTLERQWFGQDTRLMGTLRVTTIDLFGMMYAHAFSSFTQRYPDIRLEISMNNQAVNMAQRHADIAIRVSQSPPEYLVGRRIQPLEYHVFGAVSLIERIGASTPLSDYPWIGWVESVGARTTDSWMLQHIPPKQVVARVDATAMMLSLIRAGVGVAFFAKETAGLLPELRSLLKAPDNFHTSVWLLTHPELRAAARVRAFMDHMAEAPVQWPG